MRVIRSMSWPCLALIAVYGLWSQTASTLPTPSEQKDLLGKAREEIAGSSTEFDEAISALSHAAYVQPPAQATPDSAIPWLRNVAGRGVADSGLVRGSVESLDAWITALNDGSRVITPVEDLPAAMEQWRVKKSHALDQIKQAASLEQERQHAQTAMAQSKPDSPEFGQARDLEQQREHDIGTALRAAQADLEATLSIPKPFSAADRGRSPFTGPVNEGEASRVWLYADRSSAMIGESVEMQIGLANDDGPNCAASKQYPLELKCTGCEVTPKLTLESGERFKTATVRITAKTSSLKASSAGLKDGGMSVAGCVFNPKIHLAGQVLNGSAPADGVTSVAAIAIFQNDAGDPATDGHQRILELLPTGAGVKFSPAPQTGHIVRDGREALDIDECASHQELVSDHAGAATLGFKSGNEALNPPARFHFTYIWRGVDLGWWFVAALISWAATCASPLYKGPLKLEDILIRVPASLFASLAGAGIALEAAYLLLSHFDSTSDPRIPCAIAGLVGGALGLVALQRVDLYRVARKAEEEA